MLIIDIIDKSLYLMMYFCSESLHIKDTQITEANLVSTLYTSLFPSVIHNLIAFNSYSLTVFSGMAFLLYVCIPFL